MPESQQVTEYSADKNSRLVDDSLGYEASNQTHSGQKQINKMAEKS